MVHGRKISNKRKKEGRKRRGGEGPDFSLNLFLRSPEDTQFWSSLCGTTGSVASWEPWDVGSIPDPAHWVKDPVLL